MARPSAFWPSLWLGLVLFLTKAAHWSLPGLTARRLGEYAHDLAASSYADVLYALGLGALGSVAFRLAAGRPRALRVVETAFLVLCVASVIYAVASIQIFSYLRSPLTYPLLYLAGDMRNMRSSIGSFMSPGVAVALVAAPVLFLLAVRGTRRRRPSRRARVAGALLLTPYVAFGWRTAEGKWQDRSDHLIVANPHWAFVSSCVRELVGGGTERFDEPFPPGYLADFEPRPRPPSPAPPGGRPRNVVLLVLETTGTRYLSLYGSRYPTTPRLEAEAANALVFDSFYCHVGLTANAVASLSLSIYPYMTWREYTVEYPDMPGATLADVLRPHGFRTAFFHSGHLEYTQQDRFLRNRGFDDLLDYDALTSGPPLTSWGGEDRILVDGILDWIDREREKPFYVMAWTIQAHHPYEPSPDRPLIDFFKGHLPLDDYDLGRYLNTLNEVDRQLGRLFDGLRERRLADDTLVLVVGDHGEAFGHPHDTWGHGARVYEENMHVPFMIWSPRLHPEGRRLVTIGGHVDVNPTVTDLLGLPAAPSWEGRSIFDPSRPPRVYFYAANDDYLLGVREENWKYVYNATAGRDQLYDLRSDPDEQLNRADEHPEKCRVLRQRLAAWRDHAGRKLAAIQAATP